MTAPTIEAARLMGRDGGPALESERLAFEAWMEGRCWPIAAEWVDGGFRGSSEVGGHVCPMASRTRQLWAAWRDRAALVDEGQRLTESQAKLLTLCVQMVAQTSRSMLDAMCQKSFRSPHTGVAPTADHIKAVTDRCGRLDSLAHKLLGASVTLHSSGREPE